jgi:hypothetical protein
VILDKRKRFARFSLSDDVADTERFIDLILLLFGLLLPPPPTLNHLLTRIVRENSFCDVHSFFGPVPLSFASSSDMKTTRTIFLFVIVRDDDDDADDDEDGEDIIVVDFDVKKATTTFDVPTHNRATEQCRENRSCERILMSGITVQFFL